MRKQIGVLALLVISEVSNVRPHILFGGHLLLFSIILPHSVFSQKNYQPGYVITPAKDTVDGYIDYRNWSYSPNSIRFIKELESEPEVYSTSDILGFQVNQEHYFSGEVDIEISSRNVNTLDYDIAENLERVSGFLRALVMGEKWLLYLKPQGKSENFYIKKDDQFELLLYKKYFSYKDGEPVMRENRTFLGQLTLYLNDCDRIEAELAKVGYSTKSLVSLFRAYDKCRPGTLSYEEKEEKIATETAVFTGITSTRLNFIGSYFVNAGGLRYLRDIDFGTSYDPMIGVSLEVFMPRRRKTLSLQNELTFTTFDISFSEARPTLDQVTYRFKYSYLKLNTGIRVNLPLKKLPIFLNGGISNGFAIGGTNELLIEDVATTSGKLIEKIREYEQGIFAGLGIKVRNWFMEVRHESGNGFGITSASSTDFDANLRVRSKRNFLIVGYRF